jgi:hypothetical protein
MDMSPSNLKPLCHISAMAAARERRTTRCMRIAGACRRTADLLAILLALAASIAISRGVYAAEEVAQIRVVHRDVSDILTIVQPLISAYGYISADVPSNSLIVIDQPAVVDRIRELVARIDQPVPQLKIRVQFGYQDSRKEQSAGVEGRVDMGDATIGIGDQKTEGIQADISASDRLNQNRGDYIVMVRSGGTALISAGYDVPYPERWSRLAHKHGHAGRSVVFRKVDTGYEVKPLLVGNLVHIEITPRISYIDAHGLRQPVRFAEAAIRLDAPIGKWIDIAETQTEYEDLNRQILGANRTSGAEALRMRLMVTRN